ncbi:MAG: hypothetical protein AAF311_15630 [Pseudomonadota bacterium]
MGEVKLTAPQREALEEMNECSSPLMADDFSVHDPDGHGFLSAHRLNGSLLGLAVRGLASKSLERSVGGWNYVGWRITDAGRAALKAEEKR